MRSGWLLGGGLMLWAGAVLGGSALQWREESAPGARETAPEHWPEDSGLKLDATGLSLVMLAHPRCPCTRASLQVLGSVLEQAPGRFSTRVLMWVPERGTASDWSEGELWRRARELPGVEVRADPGGAEARRFGALTSGHTVVYGEDGRLLFSGGLTPARGHPGESAGSEALRALARARPPRPALADVYGCGLREPSARAPGP